MNSGQVATATGAAVSVIAAASANTIYVGKGVGVRTALLTNVDASNDMYLGGTSAVTTLTGYKLAHGTSVTLTLAAEDAVYAIAAASTPTVQFLCTGT